MLLKLTWSLEVKKYLSKQIIKKSMSKNINEIYQCK